MKIAMRVTPKASRDEVGPPLLDEHGRPLLQVRVRALPAEGEANAAVEKLMAKTLGLARASVRVVQGGKSRIKQVELGELPGSASAKLEELLTP